MDSDLWSMINKKKHKSKDGFHKEYEDFPVIYNPYSSKDIPKKLFKIDRNLKIQEVVHKDKFAAKKRRADDKLVLARSLNLGYYLIIPLLLGLFMGIWLDRVFSTKPFFLLTLFTIGIVSSFYNLWKVVKQQ